MQLHNHCGTEKSNFSEEKITLANKDQNCELGAKSSQGQLSLKPKFLLKQFRNRDTILVLKLELQELQFRLFILEELKLHDEGLFMVRKVSQLGQASVQHTLVNSMVPAMRKTTVIMCRNLSLFSFSCTLRPSLTLYCFCLAFSAAWLGSIGRLLSLNMRTPVILNTLDCCRLVTLAAPVIIDLTANIFLLQK